MARLGWHVVSVRGSHFKLVHAERGTLVVVAIHQTLKRGPLVKTLRRAGIEVDEFLEAL